MSKIKFIYFDVGGVVVLDFSKTNKWQELISRVTFSAEDAEKLKSLFHQHESLICAGMNLDEFIKIVNQDIKLKTLSGESLLSEFVNNFSANTTLWPILSKLKQSYKLGLLTNMYPGMFQAITERNIFPPITWDVVIDSSTVGHAKPYEEIYQLAESKAQVNPDQILYTDNSEKNFRVPRIRGWETVLYDSSKVEESNSEIMKVLD